MTQRARALSDDDPDGAELPSITARDAINLAREYAGELTESEVAQMTSLQATEVGGWIVDVEVVEDRRIPSSSDILALYEIEVDADGELLGFRRTRRYLRSQTGDRGGGVL